MKQLARQSPAVQRSPSTSWFPNMVIFFLEGIGIDDERRDQKSLVALLLLLGSSKSCLQVLTPSELVYKIIAVLCEG